MNLSYTSVYTWHTRHIPVRHSFSYNFSNYLIDVDDLAALDRLTPFIGWQKMAIYRFFEKDYLQPGFNNLRQKVEETLGGHGVTEKFPRIYLITGLRYFNYVFNSVSFYYCLRSGGEPGALITEINNTFGDKHAYVVPIPGEASFPYRVKIKKEFHVSPFLDTSGEYEFIISPLTDSFNVRINYLENQQYIFTSGVKGSFESLSRRKMFWHLFSSPVNAWLQMPRIHYQAARLFFIRGLTVYRRPNPFSSHTIRSAPPTLTQKMCLYLVSRILRRIEFGSIVMSLPDGTDLMFPGRKEQSPRCHIKIENYNTFKALISSGDVGAGEAYESGDWNSENLKEIFKILLRNYHVLQFRKPLYSSISRLFHRLIHMRRRNSVSGSRKNIEAHYDLSNDFFRLFLDPSMTYSSALYRNDNDSLHDAQQNKLLSIIQKAGITASHHVLEIGCGWGSFAIAAVRETGCRVTCLTLSREQKKLAESRIAAAGLSDRISIHLRDYREEQGSYDRIVSIEMLEAVGKNYLSTFFKNCDRLLADQGIMVLQVITIPEERIARYARSCDWIQKYIFPGCYVPAFSEVVEAAGSGRLNVENAENIGLHYAKTLHDWHQAFNDEYEKVRELGYSESFVRRWRYYLSYCEAGFTMRMLGTHQVVLSRQQNLALGELNAPDHSTLILDKVSSGRVRK